ncbi:hypothetical protein [Rhodococcoides yunnanense]|jgi:hypothetical protein|nr:hypothetical protein [Rhodococcus yunnanensis]MCZ4278599.1 hypothetical protein [Rhodococcus yunnanensis]
MPESQKLVGAVFTPAEEAWLAKVELTHKVPLSDEQYRVVRNFLKPRGNA